MRKVRLLLLLLLCCAMQFAIAQQVIRGKVTDVKTGSTIPGVAVMAEGTTLGTVTNINGEYSLTVPNNATRLIFSFVGYIKQTVDINNRSVIDIDLEPTTQQLGEVVVTALGISREKKSLGYSLGEVSGNQITNAASPSFMNALEGKVAGLEIKPSSGMPGAPAQMLIRGSRSFSGDNSPLYVVDGLPISSSFDYDQAGGGVVGSNYSDRALDINPNDIESVSVLKGQAAAALYGLKASNGVIIITTKSGKGVGNGKPVVSFSSNYTADVIARLPKVQQTYAQGYYNDNTTAGFYPAFSYSWGPKISDLTKDPTYGGDANGKPGQFWDPYKAAWVIPQVYNNAKNFYSQNGQTFGNNLSVSQAGDIGDYMIGFGSANQKGIIPYTGMDRYNVKLSANGNLSKAWKAGFTANYSDLALRKLPSGNNSYLFTVYGAPASFDLMGTPFHEPGTLGDFRQISYRRGAVGENPRWAIHNNKFDEKTRRLFGNAYVEFKPIEWFKVRYQFGLDTYNSDMLDYYEMGSVSAGQVLPTAGQYTTPTKTSYTYVAPYGGSMNYYGNYHNSLNSLLNITIKRKIAEGLNGILNLGNEVADNKYKSYSLYGSGFTVPGWNNMSNTSTQLAYNSINHDRTIGTFGDLSLDYLGILYVDVTGRYDIVSTMPHGNRSFFYPSVSGGIVFSELNALKNNKVLSFGKIRGSYAQVGQAGTYLPVVYGKGGAGSGFLSDGIVFPLGGITGYGPSSTLYDPNLKPQNTKTWEVGLELKFFKNRVGIDYSYSDQLAKNQIFGVPMAGSTGYSTIYMNAGKMTVKTHELVLTLVPVKSHDFEWDITALFTKYKNMCISLAPGVEDISLGGFTTPNIRASAGETYPSIYGNQFQRDAKGHILVDDNPDDYYYGMPLQGSFGKIGNVSPNFQLVVNNSFTYKVITLSAQVDWKDGGQMYSGSNRLMDLYGASARTEDRTTPYIYPGYKSDGSKNTIQRGGPQDIGAYADLYNDILGSIDEAHIYSTSFVKLREISLKVTLPKKWINSLRFRDASLFVMARNFLIWTPMPNFDPESSQGQGNMQGGMDYMSLPQTSSYGAGFNITF